MQSMYFMSLSGAYTRSLSLTHVHGSVVLLAPRGRAVAQLVIDCARHGVRASAQDLDSVDPTHLPGSAMVIFICSTTGQGEVPDNMKRFWRAVRRRSLSPSALQGVPYACFGLGDSSYAKFNAVARRLDVRLQQLSAMPAIPLALGDDQSDGGYYPAFYAWKGKVFAHMRSSGLASGAVLPLHDLPSRYLVDVGTPERDAASSGDTVPSPPAADTPAVKPGTCPAAPYTAKVRENTSLCSESMRQERDVRHLSFDIDGAGLSYECGDAVGIWPINQVSPQQVESLCARCGVSPDTPVSLRIRPSHPTAADGIPTPFTRGVACMREWIQTRVDILGTPRRVFFELAATRAADERERERLEYFGSAEGYEDLYRYCMRENRSFLEVFEDFPSVDVSLEFLFDVVPPLQPRLFSIASAYRATPHCIDIAAAVVRYTTPYGREKRGVCTAYLSALSAGDSVSLFVRTSDFRPPPPEIPMIMIGPGTGFAPFRSFLLDREARGAKGKNLVFFGCRKRDGDFLYREWMESASARGLFDLQCAFSRDQAHKIYVQHRIRDAAATVRALIAEGAHVYLAGSADSMPRDVTAALNDVLGDGAVTLLERARRFHCETWN